MNMAGNCETIVYTDERNQRTQHRARSQGTGRPL